MWSLGGILFFTLPDRIGRMPSFKLFSTMSMIAQLMILILPSFWFKMIGYILLGFSFIKSSLCYVYLFEFVHSRDKAFACSFINFLDALSPAIAGLFFLFVDLDIYPLYYITVLIHFSAYITVMYLNLETPKWLLHHGNNKEAIRILNYIGKFITYDVRLL